MQKNDNKGFMLTELLVTATLICTVLIFLYTQFYTVKRSYDNSFKYNTVNGLYALANVRDFLVQNDVYILKQNLNTNSYIDLMGNNVSGINDMDYFHTLVSSLNIKNLIFTHSNLSELMSNLNTLSDDYEPLKRFIRYIDYDESDTRYRLIVEYNDNTFASILIGDE